MFSQDTFTNRKIGQLLPALGSTSGTNTPHVNEPCIKLQLTLEERVMELWLEREEVQIRRNCPVSQASIGHTGCVLKKIQQFSPCIVTCPYSLL